MPPPSDDELLESRLRVMRILLFAMVLGASTFLVVIVVFLRAGKRFAAHPWQLTLPMGAIAFAFALLATGLSFLLPAILSGSQIRRMAESRRRDAQEVPNRLPEDETAVLLTVAQSSMMTGVALLEGAAFFNMIVFLIEGSAIAFATAILLVLMMASKYPTRFGLENWVNERRDPPQ